jgi:hypothetical protein
MAKMVKMIATETCYVSEENRLYKPGETFDMPEGSKGRGFHPVEAKPEKVVSYNQMLSDATAKAKSKAASDAKDKEIAELKKQLADKETADEKPKEEKPEAK